MSTKLHMALYGAIVSLMIAGTAQASVILSPVSATASSENSAAYDIGNTIDQSGLSAGFVSGVTDFDLYLAGNPLHTMVANDNEWFTAANVLTATIDYDLGSTYVIDRMAIWNDEFSGIGLIDVSFSLDGMTFTSAATGLMPTDHPANVPNTYQYPADVFGLAAGATRYVRLEASGCPQPDYAGPYCGMGEIAFSATTPSVPEPAALALLGLGLIGVGLSKRR